MSKKEDTALVAGVDVGAATAKALLLHDGRILAFEVIPTGYSVAQAATEVTQAALLKTEYRLEHLEYVVSTGYGRNGVPFSNEAVTEIICHAKGAHFLFPNIRAIIDIGGQDSKAIELDETGRVIDFVMNDKCAAGTGRFLEVMANVLQLDLEKLGSIALESKQPCTITNTCTIFAESEIVSLRAEGRSREDLVAGLHKSVASRVAIMAKHLRLSEPIVFTGGVAKNIGVKAALEQELRLTITVPEEPQVVGALGAALIARENLDKLSGRMT